MASMCLYPSPGLTNKNYQDRSRQSENFRKPMYLSKSTSKAIVTMKAVTAIEPLARRSGNYAPSLWSFNHIQSLSSQYTGDEYMERANMLKEAVRMMIGKVGDLLNILQMIDDLQRLGISYHFEDEIRSLLEFIYSNHYKTHEQWNKMDLNVKALGFRLLRQHGHQVPQEIFQNFKDETQNLKAHSVEDMMTILNLYEASYLSFEDEFILDEAEEFTKKYLQENQDKIDETHMSSLVTHALELPLHLRAPLVEAHWFIKSYEKRSDIIPMLFELAKLDFNMVQAVHIEDLKHASRWWRNLRWDEKLSFTRDRLVEHFLWATGFGNLPKHSLGRRTITKVNSFISSIDDVYDVFGTLEELEQFTDVIHRWDVNAIEELPDYMKICFLGFYNTINAIASDTLLDTEILILPYLKKAWAALMNAYLVEARWYNTGYTPTLQEYLDNAVVSIAGPVILMHNNFLTSVDPNDEILEYMPRLENIVHYSSIIFRLTDDLGTSTDEMARGDVPKAVECYMHESGATEEEARKYIKEMIMKTWKKLNKERAQHANSQFAREYADYATNIPRMSHFMYSDGDGHGRPDIAQPRISSLLFTPI